MSEQDLGIDPAKGAALRPRLSGATWNSASRRRLQTAEEVTSPYPRRRECAFGEQEAVDVETVLD